MDMILYCMLLLLIRNNVATPLVNASWRIFCIVLLVYCKNYLYINKIENISLERHRISFNFFIVANEAATVAYAAHCQQEKAFDRPIAGHTNICPDAIIDGEKEITMLTSTVKHELLHALGFSLRYSNTHMTKSYWLFYHNG